MSQQADTPIDRLREKHRHCSCWGENCGVKRYPKEDWNSHCEKCAATWPCDTVAALDALEARLDAATVLAEAVQWLIDEARGSREWRATRGMKPATDISRFKACSLSALIVIERELGRALSAWLAGDKEAGNE